MNIAQSLKPELNHEAGVTRKVLERIPADKFGWKPHDKSMTFGRLASHVAEIPGWGDAIINQDELDITGFQPYEAKSTEEMLKLFDDNIAKTMNALESVSDETLANNWKMVMGGQVLIEMSKIAVLRRWVLNHMIHHRAQLTVYLRENEIPVPAIYGPSADEQE